MVLSQKSRARRVLDLLPADLSYEIDRLALGRLGGLDELREIRIRERRACSVLIGCESIRLSYVPEVGEAQGIVDKMLCGALYAHRESISKGYISLGDGIRVGLSGRAALEGGDFLGLGDISSLLFRIPTGKCAFGEDIYRIFCEGIGCGMLIYSPPGVGKTTALRSLAAKVSSGNAATRVCIVDERNEFCDGDYEGCEVDILRGYKRAEGLEIATRVLSPELLMIDEIGSRDGEELINVVKCGIPIIATVHAADFKEIMIKPALKELLSCGVFSSFVGIHRAFGSYKLTADRI